VYQMKQVFLQPNSVPCHNIALRVKRGVLSVELVSHCCRGSGEQHAFYRRYAMEFSICPKDLSILT